MKLLPQPYLVYRLTGQLLAIVVLHFALQWLLPIVGTALMLGMLEWNNISILFCWLIQLAFIAASVECRDTLIKKAAGWLTRIPPNCLRPLLLLANWLVLLVLLFAVWVVLKTVPGFSLAVAIELLLMFIQVWCLCGAAVPMSAKRFYVYFFKHPKPVNNHWMLKQQKTNPI